MISPHGQHSDKAPFLSVRRCHGLGDVLMLLPVLNSLAARGGRVDLLTRKEWRDVLAKFCPRVDIVSEGRPWTIDLDELTRSMPPTQHRTKEFAELLGLEADAAPRRLITPRAWSRRFDAWRQCIVYAPEAGHNARRWPEEYQFELCRSLLGSPLILVGTKRKPALPCDVDLREDTTLSELFGVVSASRAVVCMDSGVLQVALSIRKPVVAVFGGIDPRYRITPWQRAVALQAPLACVPCNKNETCDETYLCLDAITAKVVLRSLGYVTSTVGCRVITRPATVPHPGKVILHGNRVSI